MTTPSCSDNVMWSALIAITVLVNIRDENANLVRVAKYRRFVHSASYLRNQVLGLVREHWPEAEPEDIEWHDALDALAAGGEAWWTTAAEVDGVVRVVSCNQLN